MSKNPQPPIGPEYSREREFGAILEDLRSDFRSFGEGLSNLQEQVSAISGKVEQLDQKVPTNELLICKDLSVVVELYYHLCEARFSMVYKK